MKKYALLTIALILAASTIAVADVHVVGGTGTTNNTIPFWGTYAQMRWQIIWKQSEIKEAGAVTKIEWQKWTNPGTAATFNNCKILLCHTSLSTITSDYANNYSGKTPVVVFSDTFKLPALAPNQWWTVVEPTNFTFNNTDNLLIEVVWVGASGGANAMWQSSSGQSGWVYSTAPNPTTGNVIANRGQIARITIGYVGVSPTSLGRVKSIFR